MELSVGKTSTSLAYRPISLLSNIEKIYEKKRLFLMYSRLIAFLNSHNLIYARQFGFCKGHSAVHDALYIDITECIRKCLDKKGEFDGDVFVDLKKAL